MKLHHSHQCWEMDAVKDEPQSAQEEVAIKPEAADSETKPEDGKPTEKAVPDELVRERLLVLLAESDLARTTEKMLRKQLEVEFGVQLADRKALIRDEVRKDGQSAQGLGGWLWLTFTRLCRCWLT